MKLSIKAALASAVLAFFLLPGSAQAYWYGPGYYGPRVGFFIGIPPFFPFFYPPPVYYPPAPPMGYYPYPPAYRPAVAPAGPSRSFRVYFDFNRASLTPEGERVVREAAAAFRQTGSARIDVTGYTDTSGSAQYNLALSKRRAEVVKAALIRAGVPAAAMAVSWRGESNPRVPTPDGVREPQNRRVEIVISRAPRRS
ncbi:MAG TPA: OmpA family protein [Stellaceae bacterium]|nr:OmpA family protein [Stellaceae bacterium]